MNHARSGELDQVAKYVLQVNTRLEITKSVESAPVGGSKTQQKVHSALPVMWVDMLLM